MALLLSSWFLVAALITCSCSPQPDSMQDPVAKKPSPASSAPKPQVFNQACQPDEQKLKQGSCDQGFLCVPQDLLKKEGRCLKDCGHNLLGHLVKRHQVCDEHQACMLLKDHQLITEGMFCLDRQSQKDQVCHAPFDDKACDHGLTCLPTASFEDERGKTIFGLYRCKQECSVEQPCAGAHESCGYPHYARAQKQPTQDNSAKAQKCQVSSCLNRHPSCPCDPARGFLCTKLMEGLDVGHCVRKLGICETASR